MFCPAKGHYFSRFWKAEHNLLAALKQLCVSCHFLHWERWPSVVTLPNPSIKLPLVNVEEAGNIERLCPELARLRRAYEQPWSCPLAWVNEVWGLGKGGSSWSPIALPQGTRLLQPLHQLAHSSRLTWTRQDVNQSYGCSANWEQGLCHAGRFTTWARSYLVDNS